MRPCPACGRASLPPSRPVAIVRRRVATRSRRSGDTWGMTWQWNSQLPTRSGIHSIVIVPPDGSICVTTRRPSLAGDGLVADAVAERCAR